jgi:hypothetical protein
MKYVITSFIIVLVIISCKKATIESINTNNSRDSLTYQPKVPGSKWTYRRTIGGIQNTTFTFLRLTADTTAYGSSFQIFSSDDNTTSNLNQYIRQEGNKYYSILTGSTNKPQLLVLDADKNINESWVGGINGSDTYTYTMKEKIPSFQLDGFTFKNVLVVTLNRTGPNPATGDTYYAQGVGQVKSTGTVTVAGITVSADVKVLTVDLK